MERRGKGYGGERSPAFPEPGRLQSRPEREGEGFGGMLESKAASPPTSWCLLKQERMFMSVERPRLARYLWALRRPRFSELRLAEVKRLVQVTKSWNVRAGTQSRSGMTPQPVLLS